MRLAAFALTIMAAGSIGASTITVTFDPSQPTPQGETGVAPAAMTAENNFSLWGVEYTLLGGDDSGCTSLGGNSLCFGDTIGTGADGLDLSLLSDPVLSGPLAPGVSLTFGFSTATSVLDFDVVVGASPDTSECPITPVTYSGSMPGCPASVALYDSAGELVSGGSYEWTLPDDSPITEGGFEYSGPAVSEAVLTFPGSDSTDSMFAIDNLTYQTESDQGSAAPDPPTSLLLGFALVVFSLRWRRGLRRRDAAPANAR